MNNDVTNRAQLKANKSMPRNIIKLQHPYNQDREPVEDLQKALVLYKGRGSGPPTIIFQNSKLLTLPTELLNMIAARLSYQNAITLRSICSTLHAALDLPTVKNFFYDRKWYGSKEVTGLLLAGQGVEPSWQPCHLCKRFRRPMEFAVNERFDRDILQTRCKSSKHHPVRWCLECGLTAGYYVRGQVCRYGDWYPGSLRGNFCEECGDFMKFYDYCELGFSCLDCYGGSGHAPSWPSSLAGAHNKRCHDCLAGEYR